MHPRGILFLLALSTLFTTACAKAVPVAAPPSAIPATSQEPPVRHVPGAAEIGRMPKVVDHGPREVNAVALTFDADMTESMLSDLNTGRVKSYANLAILDQLEDRGIPATFFVTGMWAQRYPEVMGRIAGQPRFEIANHTYRHAAYTPNCYTLEQLPRAEMTLDAKHAFEVLETFGGNQTRYFRFPGLCHDTPALTSLAPLGVTVVDGDVVSGDPFATASRPIVNAVLGKVKPGSVIVLHLTEGNAQYTDEALEPILDGLAERGLRPVKLSDLLASVP